MSSPSPTLSAERVIETFQTATEENQLSSLREAQVVNLPAEGELIMTGAALATLPTLAIFLFFQRYIVRGVMLAGVKG